MKKNHILEAFTWPNKIILEHTKKLYDRIVKKVSECEIAFKEWKSKNTSPDIKRKSKKRKINELKNQIKITEI